MRYIGNTFYMISEIIYFLIKYKIDFISTFTKLQLQSLMYLLADYCVKERLNLQIT